MRRSRYRKSCSLPFCKFVKLICPSTALHQSRSQPPGTTLETSQLRDSSRALWAQRGTKKESTPTKLSNQYLSTIIFSIYLPPPPIYTLKGSQPSHLSCYFSTDVLFFAKMLYKPKFQTPLWVTHHWILPCVGTMQMLLNIDFSFVNLLCPSNLRPQSINLRWVEETSNFFFLVYLCLWSCSSKICFANDIIYQKCIFVSTMISVHLQIKVLILSMMSLDFCYQTLLMSSVPLLAWNLYPTTLNSRNTDQCRVFYKYYAVSNSELCANYSFSGILFFPSLYFNNI